MGRFAACDIDVTPFKLEFALFSTDEIKRLSVVKINTSQTFDVLGHPLPGGLYDSHLGTHGKLREICGTCLNLQDCAGHVGHIELNVLVYNPFFTKLVQKIANLFCFRCYDIQIQGREIDILKLQLDLLNKGYVVQALELEMHKSKATLQDYVNQIKSEDGTSNSCIIKSTYDYINNNKESSNQNDITKTSCAIRLAILHATLQKPVNKKCIHCNELIRGVRYNNRKLMYFITKAELSKGYRGVEDDVGQYKLILADEMRSHLRKVYQKYSEFLNLICPVLKDAYNTMNGDASPVDIFFLDTIAVTPSPARPCVMYAGKIVEHPQTTLYRNILDNNAVVRVIINSIKDQSNLSEEEKDVYNKAKGTDGHEKLYNAWLALQLSVDVMMDTNGSRDVPLSAGLKQVLEKKEGLIRKHMMGKRVNYAARTVITPDPNINVEEIGLPDIFAKKLTYPEHVTPWNVSELRKMVINGPNIYPGANYIQDYRGSTFFIPAESAAKRESLAKLLFTYPENGTKIVHRHVLNGDILLLNRQPSLHKPSVMAHKARILHGEKTFRLHYSNCKAYNADFDGDEMNAHMPQNQVARSEAYNIVNVANNYLVPKDGTPLGGLIQDHIIAGVKLTLRGRFFSREDYQQLVYQGLSHLQKNIELLPPTIIKPVCLWSGKQIISTILINLIPEGYKKINLNSIAKISGKYWKTDKHTITLKGHDMSESSVLIRHGELLMGVLDKRQYGATTFGLIHCMYELYGGTVSTNALTSLTKLFTYYLQQEGFTLGVKDILVTSEADIARSAIIYESRKIGLTAVTSELGLSDSAPLDEVAKKLDEAYVKNSNFRVILDRKYKSFLDNYTNDINRTCLPRGLLIPFPHNNLQLIVLSGAKGSLVNTMQISSLLGQIELEGKRPPLMISGKSLPSFTTFETSPKSGGFIDGRFMTGIQPQDFFFHCMAGREGLVDTAVKTSRSGYLQRCLIKHLEGLTVNYDLTVRDSDKAVVQFLYGEDGMDIMKSKFFTNDYAIKFMIDNADAIVQTEELNKLHNDVENIQQVHQHNERLNKWLQSRVSGVNSYKNLSPFARFSREVRDEMDVKQANALNPKSGRSRLDEGILELWSHTDKETKEIYKEKHTKCPDPINSIYQQDRYFGSVSEILQQTADKFIKMYPQQKNIITDIIYLKNMKSLSPPGEPVGLLAAQSIGEPSTQMTLNTFHFAGRGEMNVTLGIPRLREILMIATANIKTPSMDVPIKPNQDDAAEKLRIFLNKVTLADVLEKIHVKTQLILKPHYLHKYELTFHFLPQESYKDNFCVKPKGVIKFIQEKFFEILLQGLIKATESKKTSIEFRNRNDEKSKSNNNNAEDNEEDTTLTLYSKSKEINENISSDDDQDDEVDATSSKAKNQKIDEAEYDELDDELENENINVDKDETDSLDGNDCSNLLPFNTNGEVLHNGQPAEDVAFKTFDDKNLLESYSYDKKNYTWSKLVFRLPLNLKQTDVSSIIKDLTKTTVVHQVNKINRAIIYTDNKNQKILKTDGINIAEIIKYHNVLCIDRLYTNDIHAVARVYGIEAAGQVIVNEIKNVFKVYGIEIDRRHLSLIADYMTFDGTFRPLSRKGMENSASPLQQMSFESCVQYLKNSVSFGSGDYLNSPSSRLMVGLPISIGTGSFDLLTEINLNSNQ